MAAEDPGQPQGLDRRDLLRLVGLIVALLAVVGLVAFFGALAVRGMSRLGR
jgi:hypothetical protein